MRVLSKGKQTKRRRASIPEPPDRPERVLPIEMLPTYEAPRQAEHKLAYKLLVLAGLDLLQPNNRIAAVDAWRWVFHGEEHAFSFANTCGYLGFNADAMREGFRRMSNEKNPIVRSRMRRVLSAVLSS